MRAVNDLDLVNGVVVHSGEEQPRCLVLFHFDPSLQVIAIPMHRQEGSAVWVLRANNYVTLICWDRLDNRDKHFKYALEHNQAGLAV